MTMPSLLVCLPAAARPEGLSAFLASLAAAMPDLQTVESVAALEAAVPASGPWLLINAGAARDDLRKLTGRRPPAYTVHLSAQSSVEIALSDAQLFLEVDACLSWADHPLSLHLAQGIERALARGGAGIDPLALVGTPPQVATLASLHAQYPLIERLERELGVAGVKEFHRQAMVDAAVEIINNALFDAPVDAAGKPLRYFAKDRSEDGPLAGREQVEVRWSIGPRYMVAGVTDHYGRLKKQNILDVLSKCYSGADGVVNAKATGGATIGFYTVINKVSGLVVNVDPGERTDVYCIIDRETTRKEMRAYPRLIVFKERT